MESISGPLNPLIPTITDAFERFHRQLKQVLFPCRSRNTGVPNWSAVILLDSLIPAVDRQHERMTAFQFVAELRLRCLECEPAMVVDCCFLSCVHVAGPSSQWYVLFCRTRTVLLAYHPQYAADLAVAKKPDYRYRYCFSPSPRYGPCRTSKIREFSSNFSACIPPRSRIASHGPRSTTDASAPSAA